jgi:hypothetical protein
LLQFFWPVQQHIVPVDRVAGQSPAGVVADRLVAGLIAARGTKAPANEPNEDKLWFDPF